MSWRLLFFLTLFPMPSIGQDFSFVNFSFNQGLHHTQISDISQDPYGSLWLLPLAGNCLYRFDGREFRKFSISVVGTNKVFKPYFIETECTRHPASGKAINSKVVWP